MHYYQHHINDFSGGTKNFTRLERWLYRDMIEMYYDKEQPLPADFDLLCDELGVQGNEESAAVSRILRRKFTLSELGYHHDRCDEDIAAFHHTQAIARSNGQRGGRPRKEPQPGPLTKAEKTQPVIVGSQLESDEKPKESGRQANHKPLTNNQNKETTSSPDGDLLPEEKDDVRICPVGRLVNLYHECMPNNPQVKVINKDRQGKIRQRWREAAALDCAPFGYTTQSAGLAAWREFFLICAQSDFLTGKSPAQPGRAPFIADIDFIMSPAGFAKTLENKYHREAA